MIPDELVVDEPCEGIARFVDNLVADHRRLLDRLPPLQRMLESARQSSERGQSELHLIRDDFNAFCFELRRLFESEEQCVFPMLLRLSRQSAIRPCHAGMVQARLRYTALEQQTLLARAAHVRNLAARLEKSPRVIFGRELRRMAEQLEIEFESHLGQEQNELFRWAANRERMLTGEVASEARHPNYIGGAVW